MEYTINKLARLSGISTRTLRYYDQIGLLCPKRVSSNDYRIYGQAEVDLLQQILFYRELGLSLENIRQILEDPHFDKEEALKGHLSAILQRKNQLEQLIGNILKTLSTLKGETLMDDNEKFKGFKKKLIDENENKYGEEIRTKYGNASVDASNAKLMGMNSEQFQKAQTLGELVMETLAEAFKERDPAGETAQRACDLHREWLCMFWADSAYSKEAHMALAEGYVSDERFKAYYDRIGEGCTEFLRNALNIYCNS